MPMKNPPPVADIIRREIIDEFGLGLTNTQAAAKALLISENALSDLLDGKTDLTDEVALRIQSVFGVNAGMLMRMQAAYKAVQVRKETDNGQ